MSNNKSVEPQVRDYYNSQLESYNLDIKREQESLNHDIDNALNEYLSKQGGKGGNRPDCKLLLSDKTTKKYPILIEYKGYKNKLEKLDSNGEVENKTSKGEVNFNNIKDYAVNGAIHYANAIMHYTNYDEIISIGITGWMNESGQLETKIAVYVVSKDNFGLGQKVGEYQDLSFLSKEHFDNFIQKVNNLSLSPEDLDVLRAKREDEINSCLIKLNNDIYVNESYLTAQDRVFLVIATIIATLGIDNEIKPLEKSDLKSSSEENNKDGDIILRKIEAFFEKKKLPKQKKDYIVNNLRPLLSNNKSLNEVENGESKIKRIFSKIVDDLGIYYKIGLTTDFTGKLFNEMFNWFHFAEDKPNDVVLTPPYVAKLLVKLARTNMNSYVWDFATGSAGLLVQAMNEMINDAQRNISSPELLNSKILSIKANQLLGLEVLESISMLAILNMILMGDGSSNILNEDSLKFDGLYGNNDVKKEFPADVFVLNPPYGAEGNGMIFVKKAFSMMKKGYGAIIIQSSAGGGQAKDINREILKNNTLIASIKMPNDLFMGKSSVQTQIYVFKVNEKHEKDNIVKFIDFSNDGYERRNRKKSNVKLIDKDHAKERYEEIVNLVKFGKEKLHYIKDAEYYEGHIDPDNGCDWNQAKPIDSKPNLEDFKKTVAEYLKWEVSNILKEENSKLGK